MPFRVSAIFPRNATIWSAQLVCMNLDDAGKLFALPGYASDFLIYCRPGTGKHPGRSPGHPDDPGRHPLPAANQEPATWPVTSTRGFAINKACSPYSSWWPLRWVSPRCSIASGLGLSERKREIGICKAVGWQTTDVMLMVTFEQVLLSVIAACLA